MSEPFVGEIKMFAGNFAPRGWALCDGQLLAISQNDALFSLLGTIYGGDGRTTFGLPDLRGRVPVHQGSGPGLIPRAIGGHFGTERETLTVNQLPSHRHPSASTNAAVLGSPAGSLVGSTGSIGIYASGAPSVSMDPETDLEPAGGGQGHNNLMPFLCVNFIIALFGIYPSRS